MQILSSTERQYIDILRGASVIRVVLMHLGLAWFYPPYSQYFGLFFPILFFVSGFVSYYSFNRSKTRTSYFLKRVLGISLPFIILMMPIAIIYKTSAFELEFDFWMRWLLLKPDSEMFPFPIGQIWFISVLLMLSLASYPLFLLQKKYQSTLLIAFLLSLFVSSTLGYEMLVAYDIPWPSFLSNYIIFELLSFAPFFIFGAYYAKSKGSFSYTSILVIGMLILIIWLGIDIYQRNYGGIDFSSLRPNTYIFQSFGILLTVLGLEVQICNIFNKLRRIRGFFLYCNNHAYSIFIVHIPVLVLLEKSFGWNDLNDNLVLAIIRLFLVVIISLLAAIPLSALHKFLTKRLTRSLT